MLAPWRHTLTVSEERRTEPYDRMRLESRRARPVESGDSIAGLQDAFSSIFAQQQNPTGTLYPTKALPGEDLPAGYSPSYAGFLLRDTDRVIKVDQALVKQEMDFLTNLVATACFVGGKPPNTQLRHWLTQVQETVQGSLTLGRNLGKGLLLVKSDTTNTLNKLLLTTPNRSSQGLCIFQRWVPGFEPFSERGCIMDGKTTGMKIPIWVTLKQIPDEFRGVAQQIAEGIGELLGADSANSKTEDPRFCLALSSVLGWVPSVTVYNEKTKTNITILIGYNYLPLRCRYCLDTKHRIRDCPARLENMKPRGHTTVSHHHHTGGRKPTREKEKPNTAQHSTQPRGPLPARFSQPSNAEFHIFVSKHKRKGRGHPSMNSRWNLGPSGEQMPHPAIQPPEVTPGTHVVTSTGPIRIVPPSPDQLMHLVVVTTPRSPDPSSPSHHESILWSQASGSQTCTRGRTPDISIGIVGSGGFDPLRKSFTNCSATGLELLPSGVTW